MKFYFQRPYRGPLKVILPDRANAIKDCECCARMAQACARYVVDGIWDVRAVLDEIAARLRHGDRP